jgi:hypothetical protein
MRIPNIIKICPLLLTLLNASCTTNNNHVWVKERSVNEDKYHLSLTGVSKEEYAAIEESVENISQELSPEESITMGPHKRGEALLTINTKNAYDHAMLEQILRKAGMESYNGECVCGSSKWYRSLAEDTKK